MSTKYDVLVDGVYKTSLNPSFGFRQKITDEGLEVLKALHVKRIRLEESFQGGKDGTMTGQEYAEAWEAIQNELQEAWGFDVNKDFHMFWQMKGCTCPHMDNRGNYLTGPYSYNSGCPVHGYMFKKDDA